MSYTIFPEEAYEREFPETALGGVGRGQKKVRHSGEPLSVEVPERFTKETAKIADMSERTIQRIGQRPRA